MATLGDGCSSRSGNIVKDFTYIWGKLTFPANGNIFSWCIWTTIVSGTLSGKLKVFRDDGSNFIFVGESSLISLSNGLNSGLSANINVLTGDYIGFYLEGTEPVGGRQMTESGSDTIYSKSGDISSNSLKTSWGTGTISLLSLVVTYDVVLNDVYTALTGNDSNSGGTLASAKLTLYGGIQVLNTGGNLHIGFGDFSAQTSFRVNKTMNWVFDTSGGAGTTTFPATV